MMYQLCGDTTTTGHDFANDTTAAAATRSVFAGGQSAVGNVTAAMKMDCKVLDKAKQVAVLASPQVRPLKIDGRDHYVAILHPYDALNLRQDPVWHQAQREAGVRGNDNPIFSGALGMYNGIIVHEHEYVYNYTDGSGSAAISRNVLCGQQALVLAWGRPVKWVEKAFDYENQQGFAIGAIFGSIKPMFNSVDYGVVTMFTAGTTASTA
jgi:N4-gp56 family major capsid protein